MTDTTTVRLGQVWKDTAGHLALVVIANRYQINLRYMTGNPGRLVYSDHAGVVHNWMFAYDLPRLSCRDYSAALDAARHLTSMGKQDVLVDGPEVIAPLTVPQVRMFADDAITNGWASRTDAEQMVEDYG